MFYELRPLMCCREQPKRATLDLPIYFTCDTRGRLEPCGCFVGQFGGLPRLKTVLDAKAATNALHLDVGDWIIYQREELRRKYVQALIDLVRRWRSVWR